MQRVTRRQILKASSVAGVGSLTGCVGSITSGGSETVKIGHLHPLSGSNAVNGIPAENGAKLAVKQMNENDGIGGRDIEFISRDSELSPDTSVKRAREMVENKDVDAIVGILSSSVAKALAKYCANQDLPLVIAQAQTPDITGKGCKPTTFRVSSNVDQYATSMAAYLAENEDFQTVAGINPNYTYGKQSWAAFKQFLTEEQSGVEFPVELFPQLGKGNYQNEIQKISDAEPDILFTNLFAGDFVAFAKQGKQYGLFEQIPLFVNNSAGIMDAARALKSNMVNCFGSSHYFYRYPDTQTNKDFVKAYQSEYDKDPFASAEETYTTITALKHAIEKSGEVSTDAIIDGLEGLEWDTPEGTKKIRAQDHECKQQNWMGPIRSVDYQNYYGFTEMLPKDTLPAADATCKGS